MRRITKNVLGFIHICGIGRTDREAWYRLSVVVLFEYGVACVYRLHCCGRPDKAVNVSLGSTRVFIDLF